MPHFNMCISSPVNAIEDVYVSLWHFVKTKMASKMADSRFIMNAIFFQICIIFYFFEGSDHYFSENGSYKYTFVIF